VTDLALPDLDGRTVIGANVPDVSPFAHAAFSMSDGDNVGEVVGADDHLSDPSGKMPPAVPEPSTWALLTMGFVPMGFMLKRTQTPFSKAASNKSGGQIRRAGSACLPRLL
jgi:hypothetical protein